MESERTYNNKALIINDDDHYNKYEYIDIDNAVVDNDSTMTFSLDDFLLNACQTRNFHFKIYYRWKQQLVGQ